MFKAQILGRLGRNATICETNKGTQFLTLTLAVNTKFKNEDKTFWVDVCSFNPNHLRLAKYLTKGKIVHVGGDFNSGTVTDKTGVVRLTHSIIADYINFINVGNGNSHNKITTETTNVKGESDTEVINTSNEDDFNMNQEQPANILTDEKVSVTVGTTVNAPSVDNYSDNDELPF